VALHVLLELQQAPSQPVGPGYITVLPCQQRLILAEDLVLMLVALEPLLPCAALCRYNAAVPPRCDGVLDVLGVPCEARKCDMNRKSLHGNIDPLAIVEY